MSRREWSLIFFNGAYSRAVVKCPAKSDFRLLSEFGGIVDRQEQPDQCLNKAAHHALRQCPDGPPLYARIDGIETGDGFVVMEAELIEPALFLESDMAAARFAQAIGVQADIL